MFKRSGLWTVPAVDEHLHVAVGQEVWKVDHVCRELPHKRSCVQAGGAVGHFADRLADYFANVYTFEPEPVNFRCLTKNVGHKANVILAQAALGEKQGRVGLKGDPKNAGAWEVTNAGVIPMLTIDSLGLPDCDLIYLDIEGYEIEALKGAVETINRCRPHIVVEDKALRGTKPGAIGEWLVGFDYAERDKMMRDVWFAPC